MIDILILLGLVILVGGVFAGTAYGIYIIEKKYKKPWLKYLITIIAFASAFVQTWIMVDTFGKVANNNNSITSFLFSIFSFYVILAAAMSALISSLYISIFKFVIKFTRKDENEPS